MTIPKIEPITVQPRPLNERLWELHGKNADGSITAAEKAELDALCDALEAGQDLHAEAMRSREAF